MFRAFLQSESIFLFQFTNSQIFLLYTRLSKKDVVDGTTKFAGLGSVDSKEDMITVSYELPLSKHPIVNAPEDKSKKRRARASVSKHVSETQTLEINLMQDKTMLRSKSGDTGQYPSIFNSYTPLAYKRLSKRKCFMASQASNSNQPFRRLITRSPVSNQGKS